MGFLGIDIGGTGIKGAVVDTEVGELAGERHRIPTPSPATPDAVAQVVADIATHFNYSGATGITFPGVVAAGVVRTAVHLDEKWVDLDAAKMFSDRLGMPVRVLNDADAAGIAEVRFGAAKNRDGVVIVVTLGTGIGTAVFTSGHLVPNTEFGHLQIRGKDAERRASDHTRQSKDLGWHEWADAVAEFLRELEKLFSPDLFVLGGGVSKKADKFLPRLRERCRTEIVPAEMQNAAGIVGAAWAAGRISTGGS